MAEPNRTVLTESDITTPGPLKTALDSAGGDGAVSSVNGSTGDVVLSAADIGAVSRADFVDQVSGVIYDGDTPIPFGPDGDFTVGVAVSEAFGTANLILNLLDQQSIGIERAQEKVNDLLVRSGIQTLTNPTTIPVDGPERLDLVFTEPTTVSFEEPFVDAYPTFMSPQAPGVTDLVLSIEGYEHVTWDGVAVHGTPDQSGVVWASALWRQRDSSWHLLCEQDASQGGGIERAATSVPVAYANMTYVDPSTGELALDEDGYTTMHEEAIPPYNRPEYKDHVTRWSEMDAQGVEDRYIEPVKTGAMLPFAVSFVRVKGVAEGDPLGGSFTDGVRVTLNFHIQGPDVRISGSAEVAGDTGLGNFAPYAAFSTDVLGGYGGGIAWQALYENLMMVAGRFQLLLLASPNPADGVGVTFAILDAEGIDPETGLPAPGNVVMPPNPDREDGIWVSNVDFIVPRSGGVEP